MEYRIKDNSGSSLIELVIAISLFALLSASAVGLLLMTINMNERSRIELKMRSLDHEVKIALQTIVLRDVGEISYNQSGIEFLGGEWSLSGEGTSELIDDVTRIIEFTDIYRSSSTKEMVLASDPEAILDSGTKQVDITLTYTPQFGEDIVKRSSILLTNY